MSKQLELPITPRRRVTVVADIDFDDAIQKATDVVNAAGPTQEAASQLPGLRLIDGDWLWLSPWFEGEATCPVRDGWYEVTVDGKTFDAHGYWCDATSDFRIPAEDGSVEFYASELVTWRGLTQPAPGGYGKDRGKRVTRTPVMPRRRVVLAD